jgi:hypothetical protein
MSTIKPLRLSSPSNFGIWNHGSQLGYPRSILGWESIHPLIVR